MAGLGGIEQARLTTATAVVEVMPSGLSSTSQPCTGSPLLRRPTYALLVIG
jgi:hypothetical protein